MKATAKINILRVVPQQSNVFTITVLALVWKANKDTKGVEIHTLRMELSVDVESKEMVDIRKGGAIKKYTGCALIVISRVTTITDEDNQRTIKN